MTNTNFSEVNTVPQEQGEPRTKNANTIVAIVSVFLIAAIIVFVVLLAKKSNTGDSSPEPTESSAPSSNVTPLSVTERAQAGISLGKDLIAGTTNEGAPQVDIYFDYTCPYCATLESQYGAALSEAAQKGDITLVYHPVKIHEIAFSYTGPGAEFFVADNEPDKYFQFHTLLHEKLMVPYMNGEITNPQAKDLVDVAREAGVSEENCQALLKELTDMEDVLSNGGASDATSLLTTVAKKTDQFIQESVALTGGAGTPTVYIDNVQSESWSTDIPNLLNK